MAKYFLSLLILAGLSARAQSTAKHGPDDSRADSSGFKTPQVAMNGIAVELRLSLWPTYTLVLSGNGVTASFPSQMIPNRGM
jgi:hypothetical protein